MRLKKKKKNGGMRPMTVNEVVRTRRSIRKYKSGAKVSDEQIKQLLEAAMLAPSACNTRPWEFIVVRDRDKLDQIRKTHPYTGMLETASLAIVICALPESQAEVNNGLAVGYYPQDCGAATQNILIQAIELGLGTCWCGVYPKEDRIAEMREILGTTKIPFNVIAVGVPDEDPASRGCYDESKVTYV
jgi:nitroreductase